jgi:capsid portal protein
MYLSQDIASLRDVSFVAYKIDQVEGNLKLIGSLVEVNVEAGSWMSITARDALFLNYRERSRATCV